MKKPQGGSASDIQKMPTGDTHNDHQGSSSKSKLELATEGVTMARESNKTASGRHLNRNKTLSVSKV